MMKAPPQPTKCLLETPNLLSSTKYRVNTDDSLLSWVHLQRPVELCSKREDKMQQNMRLFTNKASNNQTLTKALGLITRKDMLSPLLCPLQANIPSPLCKSPAGGDKKERQWNKQQSTRQQRKRREITWWLPSRQNRLTIITLLF